MNLLAAERERRPASVNSRRSQSSPESLSRQRPTSLYIIQLECHSGKSRLRVNFDRFGERRLALFDTTRRRNPTGRVNPELEVSYVVERHQIDIRIGRSAAAARRIPWSVAGPGRTSRRSRRSSRRRQVARPLSSRRNKIGPIASSSPDCSVASSCNRPLTRTPFRLPRSRIKIRSYAVATQQWRRETLGESMRTSHSGCRPIKSTGR